MSTTVQTTDLFQERVQYLKVVLNVLDYYTLGEDKQITYQGQKSFHPHSVVDTNCEATKENL
jgi:hypothetical protein